MMLYIIVYLLNLADLIITHYAVTVWGIATEANLLMAPLLESWAIVFIKVFLMAFVSYTLYRKRHYRVARRGVVFLLVLYSLVVVWNSLQVVLHFIL